MYGYNDSMNITEIKKEFPIFKTHPKLVYLDNAASAQKPQSVVDAEVKFYAENNANVHRGIYELSEKATELYEQARDTVAHFINAEREEIIFTSGTTDSINGVAASLVMSDMVAERPRIMLTELEHHAMILPWMRLKGVDKPDYLAVDEKFKLNLKGTGNDDAQDQKYPDRYDVLGITHVSNVTGTVNNIKEIKKELNVGYTVLDAAQSVAHMPVDVKSLGVDFAAFSGHKLYGPTGVGVLFGKRTHLERMEPFRVGGGMIMEVQRDDATWADIPAKFEAGTPQVAQAIGLAAAIDFVTAIGWEAIQEHEQDLRKYALEALAKIPGIKIFHPPASEAHAGVISFTIEGLHAHDISQILASKQIAVRAGHHCTHILHREILQVASSVRISLGIYNDESDIDKLIKALQEAIQTLSA